MEGVISTK